MASDVGEVGEARKEKAEIGAGSSEAGAIVGNSTVADSERKLKEDGGSSPLPGDLNARPPNMPSLAPGAGCGGDGGCSASPPSSEDLRSDCVRLSVALALLGSMPNQLDFILDKASSPWNVIKIKSVHHDQKRSSEDEAVAGSSGDM